MNKVDDHHRKIQEEINGGYGEKDNDDSAMVARSWWSMNIVRATVNHTDDERNTEYHDENRRWNIIEYDLIDYENLVSIEAGE